MLELQQCNLSSKLVFAFMMDSCNMRTAPSSPTALLRRTGELRQCCALALTAPLLGCCFMNKPPRAFVTYHVVTPHCWRCGTVLTPPHSCSHRWCWKMRDSCRCSSGLRNRSIELLAHLQPRYLAMSCRWSCGNASSWNKIRIKKLGKKQPRQNTTHKPRTQLSPMGQHCARKLMNGRVP